MLSELKFRLLVFLLLLSGTALTQEKDSLRTRHLIALQFGLNQIKDEILHP